MTPPSSRSVLSQSSVCRSVEQQSFSNPESPGALSVTLDGLSGSFREQATDWRIFAAVTAGGLAYRSGNLVIRSAGAGRMGALPLRLLGAGAGLSAEVTAFELANRGLAPASNPNRWSWNGPGGLRQGLLQSGITFGALRGAGHLAQGENLLAQHLLQDSAMVFGHNVSASLGLTPHPAGTLSEQFLQAESMNLQMGAGMALGQRLVPRFYILERGLDLSLPHREAPYSSFPLRQSRGTLLMERLGPFLASATGLATLLAPEIARASVETSAQSSSPSEFLAGLALLGGGILAMAMGGGEARPNGRKEAFRDLEFSFAEWEDFLSGMPEGNPTLLGPLRNYLFQRLFMSHDPGMVARIRPLLSGLEIAIHLQPHFLTLSGSESLDPAYSILEDTDLAHAMTRGLLQESDYEDLRSWLNNPPRLSDDPLYREVFDQLRSRGVFAQWRSQLQENSSFQGSSRRPAGPLFSSDRNAQLTLLAERLAMEKMIRLFETLDEIVLLPPGAEPSRIHELIRENGVDNMFFQGERNDPEGQRLLDSGDVYLIAPVRFPWRFVPENGQYLAHLAPASQEREARVSLALMPSFRSYEDYLLQRPAFQASFERPTTTTFRIFDGFFDSPNGPEGTPRLFRLTSLREFRINWLTLAQAVAEGDQEAAEDLAAQFRSGNFQALARFTELAESENVTAEQSLTLLKAVRVLFDDATEKLANLKNLPDPFRGGQVVPLLRKAISDTEILTELQCLCEFSSVLRNFLEGHRDYSDFKGLAGYDFRVLEFLTSIIIFFPSASDSAVEILGQVDLEQLWNRIRTENQLDFFDIAFVLAHDLGLESGLNFLRNFNPPPMVWARVLHLWNSRVKFLTEIGNPHAAVIEERLRGGDPPPSG